MHRGSSVWFSIIVTVLLILPPATHAATPRTLVATVECVSDGDTITAFISGGTKLRLLGVDAPELGHGDLLLQPFSEETRDSLGVPWLGKS